MNLTPAFRQKSDAVESKKWRAHETSSASQSSRLLQSRWPMTLDLRLKVSEAVPMRGRIEVDLSDGQRATFIKMPQRASPSIWIIPAP